MKKEREREILLKVYKESENEIQSLKGEKPDFLLYNYGKNYLFGVEITETFFDESSARLKKSNGYLDKLIRTGEHIHIDDVSRLFIDEISVLDSDGNVKFTSPAVMQNRPVVNEYLEVICKRIAKKNSKYFDYSKDAKFHNLILLDSENFFDEIDVSSFYGNFFVDDIIQSLIETSFREVFYIGSFKGKSKYIPLKGLYFLGVLHLYNSYEPTERDEKSLKSFINRLLYSLNRIGLGNIRIHEYGESIAMSFGDMSVNINFTDFQKSFMFQVRDLDYADEQSVLLKEYSNRLPAAESEYIEFKEYLLKHSFFSNYAFEINP